MTQVVRGPEVAGASRDDKGDPNRRDLAHYPMEAKMICRLEIWSRTTALSAAMLVLMSLPAAAQSLEPAGGAPQTVLGTPAFAGLKLGTSVIVTRKDGTSQKGTVKAISTAGLTIAGHGFAGLLPIEQIAIVKKPSHRIRNGTLVGLGAGVAAGVVACGDDGCEPLFPLIGIGIGVGAGATVGAVLNHLLRDKDVIYDARRPTTTMTFAPILSPTRKGVVLAMTWR